MTLLDSNVIIGATKLEFPGVRHFVRETDSAVSKISLIECLGYVRLTADEREELEDFFSTAFLLSVDDVVIDEAVRLRQGRKLSLGDSIVAATALVFGLDLATRNTADFVGIPGLN